MHVTIDPPPGQWTPPVAGEQGVVIATGHQAWLWHPGILAKLFAMQAAAELFRGRMCYFVVDQDVHEALMFEQPRLEGDRLTVEHIRLGEQQADVPTGLHPPVKLNTSQVRDERVREALDATTGDSLAEQMTSALMDLIDPLMGKAPVRYVSKLPEDARYRSFVELMIADARGCAEAYNATLREAAVHDVAALRVGDESVELPLWHCAWGKPRRRVYVSDGKPVGANGDEISSDALLLPRALTLSAVIRSLYSALFIHGIGGGVYDRATEQWWQKWRGEALSPMAVVSADLTLDFDVPVAGRAELDRAIWRRHHLRHNLDPDKGELLRQMSASNDRAERAAVFRAIHEANAHAAAADPKPLREADRAIARARAGLANAAAAAKRDWCFALYPREKLIALCDAIAARVDTIQP